MVLTGELDAALVAEPVADLPFEKVPIYDEELVIVAGPGHAPVRSPCDAQSRTVLAFETGCPYRLRLEQWFAHCGALPERIIEMSSWHAILGCTAAGMGVAVLPKMVLTTFPQRKFVSTHPLPPGLSRAPTVLIWRKGAHSPNVAALLEVLTAKPSKDRTPSGRRSGSRRNLDGSTAPVLA